MSLSHAMNNEDAAHLVWDGILQPGDGVSLIRFDRSMQSIAPSVHDIYSAKLPATMRFCTMVKNGEVEIMRGNKGSVTKAGVFFLISTMAHFDWAFRARVARVCAPSFYVRTVAGPLVAMMSFDHIAKVTGFSIDTVEMILRKLQNDRAIDIVMGPSGTPGARIKPGFVEDADVRRYFVGH